MHALLHTLDAFEVFSGLKVNYDKTEILRIGSLKNSIANIYTRKPLKWTGQPLTILGIKFILDGNMTNINFEQLIQKNNVLTKLWQMRDLTWMGKIWGSSSVGRAADC